LRVFVESTARCTDLATEARLALLENNAKLAEEKLRELIDYLSVA
jgi:hypothetical protein